MNEDQLKLPESVNIDDSIEKYLDSKKFHEEVRMKNEALYARMKEVLLNFATKVADELTRKTGVDFWALSTFKDAIVRVNDDDLDFTVCSVSYREDSYGGSFHGKHAVFTGFMAGAQCVANIADVPGKDGFKYTIQRILEKYPPKTEEPMEEFDFTYDEKVTTWIRRDVKVKAYSKEEALQYLIDHPHLYDVDGDIIEIGNTENLVSCEEPMDPEQNKGFQTIEIYVAGANEFNPKNRLWDNSPQ